MVRLPFVSDLLVPSLFVVLVLGSFCSSMGAAVCRPEGRAGAIRMSTPLPAAAGPPVAAEQLSYSLNAIARSVSHNGDHWRRNASLLCSTTSPPRCLAFGAEDRGARRPRRAPTPLQRCRRSVPRMFGRRTPQRETEGAPGGARKPSGRPPASRPDRPRGCPRTKSCPPGNPDGKAAPRSTPWARGWSSISAEATDNDESIRAAPGGSGRFLVRECRQTRKWIRPIQAAR